MKKRILTALLCGAIAVTAVGCSTNKENNNQETQVEQQKQEQVATNVSVKDIVAEAVEAGYVRMPVEIDDTIATDMYHLNLEDVKEYAIAETGIMPGPGLIVMVEANEGKLDNVKAAVEQIKTDKVGSAFYPEERDAAELSQVEVVGNIVYYTLFNSEIREEATTFLTGKLQ